MLRRGTEYESEAANLQDAVIIEESTNVREGEDYSDEHVRVATVHARQDIVLMVSYLRSLNRYVTGVRARLNIVILLLGAILTAVVLR